MNPIRRWFIKRRIRKQLVRRGFPGKETLTMQNVIKWILTLNFIPSGWLTLAAGWSGILAALACFLGYPPPGFDCPADPWGSLVAGLVGVGLGRRK